MFFCSWNWLKISGIVTSHSMTSLPQVQLSTKRHINPFCGSTLSRRSAKVSWCNRWTCKASGSTQASSTHMSYLWRSRSTRYSGKWTWSGPDRWVNSCGRFCCILFSWCSSGMDITFLFCVSSRLFSYSSNHLCGVTIQFCLLKRITYWAPHVVSTTSVLLLLFEVLKYVVLHSSMLVSDVMQSSLLSLLRTLQVRISIYISPLTIVRDSEFTLAFAYFTGQCHS